MTAIATGREETDQKNRRERPADIMPCERASELHPKPAAAGNCEARDDGADEYCDRVCREENAKTSGDARRVPFHLSGPAFAQSRSNE